ncbi:MAG: PAS domain S-box protein [Deltaproteobacteria bacterium]|nr:PAS domain S-box protein [Deltaproteobacteria bacterium]
MGDKYLPAGSALKVWTAIFAVIALTISAGGYWYYRKEAKEIRHEKYQAISAIGRLKSAQIQQWRKERLGDISVAAKNPFLAGAIGKFSMDPATPGLQAELREFLNATVMADGYSDARLLDLNGNILVGVNDTPDPVGAATRRAIAKAIARREAVLSDFFRCPDGFVHIDVAAVVLDSEGQPVAVAILRSNAETYLYPLIQSWPTPSSSAETLLVQQEGEEIVFLNELRHKARTAISLRMPLTRTDLPGVQAVLGKQGKFEGQDYRGVEVVADLRPIPGSSWFMVAKMDAEEIFAEARYRASVIAVIVGSYILLAAAATVYFYRRRQVHNFRDRYEAERQQREIQETYRITLYSIGDAVITTDTGGRARHLNPVAERLTGWTEAEARGRPLEEIFRIVNEETHAIVEDPVQRVLRDGAVVGLANHTLLIARDGTERPIADSGAPIREESGAVIGVVLVFHDQTEERAAQRALIESEERLRLALAAANQGLYDLNVQTGECVVSPEYARMLGYDPAEFRENNSAWRERLHPDDREKVYRRYEDYVAGLRDEYRVEYRQRTQSGDWKWILSLGRLVSRSADGQPLRMLGTHTDITERKRAEDALRESEDRFRMLFESAPVGIFTTSSSGQPLAINLAMARILGFPSPEEALEHYTDLSAELYVHAERRDEFIRLLRDFGRVEQFEYQARTAAGGIIWLSMNARVSECTKDGSFIIEGFATDITERKQAEEALRENEHRLRIANEAGRIGTYVTNLEADKVYWSPELCAILGVPPGAERTGDDAWKIVHEDDLERVLAESARGMDPDRDGRFSSEHRIVRPDGQVRWVLWRGRTLFRETASGRIPSKRIGACVDITERKQA